MSSNPSSQTNYLPISEAAKFLGVSLDTLRRWDKSGILKSKRLDGKNRYFSLEDLKKNRSNKPLSISEVSKKLNISATTIRRLEARGVIKPSRNKAGERVFDLATIESFRKSEYFQRKKYTFKKEKSLPKKEQPLKIKKIPAKEELDIQLDSNQTSKPALGSFLSISTAAFILLATVGLGNVFLFKTQNYEMVPLPTLVLGEKITAPLFTPTPPLIPAPQTSEPDETSSIDEIQIQNPQTPLENYLAQSLQMINEKKQYKKLFQTDSFRFIEIATDSAAIQQKPHIFSPIIGSAQRGEVFEFLSFDSGWIELRLHESTSSGFIEEQYARVKEFEFSLPEYSLTDVNESTNSALIEGPTEATKEGEYDQSSN